MIYDCFPFFNELDILKLRMEIMDPFVDKFADIELIDTTASSASQLVIELIKNTRLKPNKKCAENLEGVSSVYWRCAY